LPPEFWSKVAKTYYLAGDLENASRAIEAGQKFNPEDFRLWLVDGFLQWKRGDWNQARRSLRHFLTMNAQNPQASHGANFINDYWGHPAEAAHLLADLGSLESG